MASTCRNDVDRGWAWVVLVCAFLTRFILGGLIWSITAFFVVFHEEFAENRSFTSVIGSATMAALHVFGPVSSVIMQRYGVRLTNLLGTILLVSNFVINTQANGVIFLIITHCLFFGVGLCLINNSSLVALSQYFKRYMFLSTGVSLAGCGIGIFAFAFLVPSAIDFYGWRGAQLVLAGCALQVLVCGFVIFPIANPAPEKSTNNVKRQERNICSSTLYELCINPSFWLLSLANFFIIASYSIVTVVYKDFAVSRQLAADFTWTLAAFGFGDLTGRVLSGLIASWKKVDVCLQTSLTNLGMGVVILFHLIVWETISLSICGFLLGALSGAQISLLCICPAAVFGRGIYIIVIGYVQVMAGIGGVIGPPIAGYIADHTKSYDWSLGFVVIVNCVASLLMFVIFLLKRKPAKTKDEDDVEIKMNSNDTKPIKC